MRISMEKLLFIVFGLTLLMLAAINSEAFQDVAKGDKPLHTVLSAGPVQEIVLDEFHEDTLVLILLKQGQQRSEEALKALVDFKRDEPSFNVLITAVLVNSKEGETAVWQSAVETDLGISVFLDSGGEVFSAYKSNAYPAVGVFGREDGFRGYIAGYLPTFNQELKALLQINTTVSNDFDKRKKAENNLNNARKLLEEGSIDAAVQSAKDAVSADESSVEALVFLGTSLLDISEDNADEALKYFERAGMMKRRDMNIELGVARIKSIRGDYEGAAAILESAIGVSPNPERLYYRLGLIHEKAGNYDKAVNAYRKALDRLLSDISD